MICGFIAWGNIVGFCGWLGCFEITFGGFRFVCFVVGLIVDSVLACFCLPLRLGLGQMRSWFGCCMTFWVSFVIR